MIWYGGWLKPFSIRIVLCRFVCRGLVDSSRRFMRVKKGGVFRLERLRLSPISIREEENWLSNLIYSDQMPPFPPLCFSPYLDPMSLTCFEVGGNLSERVSDLPLDRSRGRLDVIGEPGQAFE